MEDRGEILCEFALDKDDEFAVWRFRGRTYLLFGTHPPSWREWVRNANLRYLTDVFPSLIRNSQKCWLELAEDAGLDIPAVYLDEVKAAVAAEEL